MSSTSLPRGVQIVKWKNKVDKTTQIRYRVRIVRKDYKSDRLFDNLDEAVEFLNLSKSRNGKELIYSITEKEKQEAEAIANFIKEPPISTYIDIFTKDYIETRDRSTYLTNRTVYNTLSFYRTIKKTEIEIKPDLTKNFTGVLGMIAPKTKKKFGDLKVSEITPIEINSYVKARLAQGIKKSSLSREITCLNKFFKKLRFIDPQFTTFTNPVDGYDRELISNRITKREFRLSKDDEKLLFEELDKYSNPELKQITFLSLLTAMRRSEIINLEWSQVNEKYLQLIHTKSGRPRKVWLTPQARTLINSIQKKPNQARLFTYTITGFEGSWVKFKERIGLKHLRFHDLRRESISRFIEQIGADNSILITEILGIANVRKFEETHIQDTSLEISTEKDLLKSVGHSNKQTTKIYTNLPEE